MMDLKKCCNHPYLFPTAAEVRGVANVPYSRKVWQTQSSKDLGKEGLANGIVNYNIKFG